MAKYVLQFGKQYYNHDECDGDHLVDEIGDAKIFSQKKKDEYTAFVNEKDFHEAVGATESFMPFWVEI